MRFGTVALIGGGGPCGPSRITGRSFDQVSASNSFIKRVQTSESGRSHDS